MSELDELKRRLEALEGESGVVRTLNQYCHTIGVGDENGWLDCFAEDGVFDVERRELSDTAGAGPIVHPHPDMRGSAVKMSVCYNGREDMCRFISRHPRPPARYHKHIMIDPMVTVSGSTANCVSAFMRLDAGRDGAPHLTAFGLYRDELKLEADGRWRFVKRTAEVQSRGPDPFG